MRRASRVLISLAILTAAGCSDSDEPSADPADTTATTGQEAAPSTTPTTTMPESTTTTAPTTTAPPTTAPPTTAPPTTAPGPTPWMPVPAGEFEVGVTTVTIDDPAGERPLTVDVWFPLSADVDTASLPAQQYTLLPGVFYESPAALAAEPGAIAPDGPYPLVVYSHGSGGIRYLHSSYTEALAAHGYVVVAPDHTGNTVFERFAGSGAAVEEIAFDRPVDVRRLIDAFVDPAHPAAGAVAAWVDTERIAVTGHSFGGYTSLVAATGVSTTAGEVPPDDRIDAIVPLAPALGESLVTDDLFAALEIPFMVVVGTDDSTTPVEPNVTRLWELTDGTLAYRVELVAAEHQTFTDLCAYAEFLPTLPDIPEIITDTIITFGEEGCSPGDIDAERAAELTNSYVIRFLDEVFRGGPGIDPETMAVPDDVIFDRR